MGKRIDGIWLSSRERIPVLEMGTGGRREWDPLEAVKEMVYETGHGGLHKVLSWILENPREELRLAQSWPEWKEFTTPPRDTEWRKQCSSGSEPKVDMDYSIIGIRYGNSETKYK